MYEIEDIWVSSEEHLKALKRIKSDKTILKNIVNLSADDECYNFPRVLINNREFPVAFNNKGSLILSEKNIEFKSSYFDRNQYRGINKMAKFILPYTQIKKVELIRYKISFLSYFDVFWIKILYNQDNGDESHILISNSGNGFVMNKIKKANANLMELINKKLITHN